jgi:hypothetical protein
MPSQYSTITGKVVEVNEKLKTFVLDNGQTYKAGKQWVGNLPKKGDIESLDVTLWADEGRTPIAFVNRLKDGSYRKGGFMESGNKDRNIARSVALNNVFGNVDSKKLSLNDVGELLKKAEELEKWLTRP